jgi:fructosamine-3-kinase
MDKIVEDVILNFYKVKPDRIISFGGGFYGRVFLASINKEPYNVIVKIYLFPQKASKEALQINILSKYSLIKMPIIYYIHESSNFIPNDILLMEYIPGINAGKNDLIFTEENRLNIAEKIVDNLISYHKTINEKGFGEISSVTYEPNWNDFYEKKAIEIMYKAEKMYTNGRINDNILKTMNRAIKYYDKIFYLQIDTARLIHGDYNTWNILLDEQLSCVKAVIDPYNCSWADSEFDLYQLNNANGRYYELFDIYSSKNKLSENYKIKIAFYELFTEIMHYYDANIDTRNKMNEFNQEADNLSEQMHILGV